MDYVFDKANGITVLEPVVYVAKAYHYLHKKYEHLVPLISKQLAKMKAEGEINEIFNEVRAAKSR